MSAALVDEFAFQGYGLRAVPSQREAGIRSVPARPAPVTRRPAPCDHGVPIVAPHGPSWRLTERGIAVVLALFVGLFFAAVAVVVGAFLAVPDSPVHSAAGSPALVSVVGG